MKEALQERVETVLGVLLVAMVAGGTIFLSPVVAQGSRRTSSSPSAFQWLPDPTVSEVDREVIFPSGHALTDAANEQVVLSAGLSRRCPVWTSTELNRSRLSSQSGLSLPETGPVRYLGNGFDDRLEGSSP